MAPTVQKETTLKVTSTFLTLNATHFLTITFKSIFAFIL